LATWKFPFDEAAFLAKFDPMIYYGYI